MPRLLQIDSCLGILSTGRITEGIAKVAQENGWECYIAHGARYVGKTRMNSYQIGTKYSEYVHFLQSFLSDRHGLGSVSPTKRLIQKIKDIRPDLIHLHCIHGYYLNYKILFECLNEINTPVVWTFHDCWAFTGHCAHFVTSNCEAWKSTCRDCPQLNGYPKSLVDNSTNNQMLKRDLFLSNRNLHIVAVSSWLRNLVGKSFFADTDVTVIHNGVDLEKFTPMRKRSDKQIILGVSSSWNESKGLLDFYKLREKLDERFEILLVGLSDSQINDLPKGIRGIKKTTSIEHLAKLYSEAMVLVNPTYADSFPTVNLEALACGTPVITYDTGGSPEAIDEKTGVVVAQGDVDGIINAIRGLEENPLSSEDCRLRAVRCFDQNDRFMDYVHLYEELIK